MRVAYMDCIGGASGDMLLGALLDAGVSESVIRDVISALHLPDCGLQVERVMRGAMSARQATVFAPKQETPRHASELLDLIARAALPPRLQERASAIVQRLAQVEATIHQQPVETVHLHELGGDDTVIDIVGVLCALQELQIEQVYVSPLPLARGWTRSMHGQLPLPAPATLALLEGVPVYYVEQVQAELVTPTGAVLLTSLAHAYGDFPPMTLRSIGTGAGRRELPFPNVVRVLTGEVPASGPELIVETLQLLETNVDDLNPQIYEHVFHRLFAAGALDVTLTPLQMKKNRPGEMLSVLCRPAQADALQAIIFAETSTLGVRRSRIERVSLPRTFETVETPFGAIRLKVARWGEITRATPEYEDCRRAAEAYHTPLVEVMAAAQEAYRSGDGS